MPENVLSVKQLNFYVKSLLESNSRLAYVSVSGEISNFKSHLQSGHWYFTLKDADAAVSCVMFKGSNIRIPFSPENGISVVVSGRISLYEKDGRYQLYAEEMHAGGDGDIALAYRQVKEKLEKEGLFDAEGKRPLPQYPEKIAVITSETGAAVRDIISITARRYPLCKIVLCPTAVQGESALSQILETLDRVYMLDGLDAVIIGRGGGSAEDLMVYNSELLARKIYESPVPVISAVGHETDFTICDFVADVRAATPSAAAELAVPDGEQLLYRINSLRSALTVALNRAYNNSRLRFNELERRNIKAYGEFLNAKSIQIKTKTDALKISVNKVYFKNEANCKALISSLDALSPLKVLSRGYAAVSNVNGIVKSAEGVSIGDNITVAFSDGKLDCRIENITREKDYVPE